MSHRDDEFGTGCRKPVSPKGKSQSMPVPVPKPRPLVRPRTQVKAATIAQDIQVDSMFSTSPGAKPSLPPKPRREPPDAPTSLNIPKKPNKEGVRKPVSFNKAGLEKAARNTKEDCVDCNSNNESLKKRIENGAGIRNSVISGKERRSRERHEDLSGSSDDESEDVRRSIPGRKTSNTSSPNKLDFKVGSASSGSKIKPLPPRKPLPQLPKHPQDCPSAPCVTEKKDISQAKPPVPSKPPPKFPSASPNPLPKVELHVSPQTTSVAALASKLAAVPVFPFKPLEDNKLGSITSSTSPRLSPRPSPVASPHPSPSVSPSLHHKSVHSTGVDLNAQNKENGVAERFSSVRPKPVWKPVKPDSHAKDSGMYYAKCTV